MDVKLVLFKQNGQRKDIPLSRQSTVLGRAEDCDLRIPIGKVSRRHCELVIDGDSLTVNDLGSANGTLVNGDKVEQAELKPGDSLTLGTVTLIVQIDGQPAEIQPPPPPSIAEADAKADSDEEEVVELDAGPADGDSDDVLAALQDGLEGEDPIAALEALAGKKPKDKPKA